MILSLFCYFRAMNFIKQLFCLTIIISLFTACTKESNVFDPIAQFESEKPIIKSYVNSNYPEMTLNDTTGIWFEIVDEGMPNSYEYKVVDTTNMYGQTVKALRMPTITVRYTGKLISDNSVFDSNTTTAGLTSKLNNLIGAWQLAFIPKDIGEFKFGGLTPSGLQIGSKIRIVTPSYYGYGASQQGKIPANSPLFFEIEVVNIK